MENIWKPRGALKSQKPDAGGAVLRNHPMLGVVKDNVDPTRSGRIRVFISALGAPDPDDEKNWTPVLYMSPYFGMTDTTGGNKDFGSFKANPASYGMWVSPPDIGTIVIVQFINGDPNFGFYIGSIPDAEAMRMVPAIGANFTNEDVIFNESEATKFGGATRVPVTNMNTNNSNQTESSTFLTSPKPVHSFQASIMFQQGILRDPVRGPISTSSQRESPSRVGWGVSTPGRPIYQGGYTDETIAQAARQGTQKDNLKIVSRRGGHSIVMDDGDLVGQDNLIRIRTSLGHQILMSDDGQTLMILHSNGQSYIELGKEGTVDVYATNSINLRTQGDLNLHADNNININAAKDLNINAENINVNATKDYNQLTGSNHKLEVSSNYSAKVGGTMSMGSEGVSSYASSSTTYINGSVINLNTGSTPATPEVVKPIPLVAQTDTLFSSEKGWAAAPGKLLTIVSRAPAHAPWANAGQGVDVKVNLNASSQLPSSPSPQVQTVNATASTTSNYAPVSVPGQATVPAVNSASKALNKSATSAMVSASAAQAATGASAAAVKAGAGKVKDATGKVVGVAVGTTGLTAKELENAGVIKPGSGTLVNALVQQGKNVPKAMPTNLFTGIPGAGNLPALVNNPTAQVNATVTNIQQAQTALTKTGLITGNEGPAGIAGTVLATAKNGIGLTVNTIKSVGTSINVLTNNITGSASSVMSSIAGGTFAANLSQNVTGGLSGIVNSVKSMSQGLAGVVDNARGVAASAFASITNSFKPFKAGVPQNLKAVTEQSNQTSIEKANTDASDPYEGLDENQIAKLGTADPTDPLIRSRLGLPPLVGTQSNTATASALASGVSNLPGGTKTVTSVVNSVTGQTIVPGSASVKSLIDNASTGAINNIGLESALSASRGLNTGLPVGSSLFADGQSAFNKLKSGQSNLTSLVSSGLSPAATSQLNSAISSLSSGGPISIKIPSVSLDTVDRGELTASVSSLLPAGVPAPNFTGVSKSTVSTFNAIQSDTETRANELLEYDKKVDAQQRVVEFATAEWENARNNLPAGDPTVITLKQKLDEEFAKLNAILNENPNA